MASRISDLAPTGVAHQFEQQREAARCTLSVQGGWLCSLLVEIMAHLATQPFRRGAFPSLNIAFVRPHFFRQLNSRRCQRFMPPPESPCSKDLYHHRNRLAAPESLANIVSRCERRQSLLPRLARVLFPQAILSALAHSLGTPWSTALGPDYRSGRFLMDCLQATSISAYGSRTWPSQSSGSAPGGVRRRRTTTGHHA